MPEGDTIFRAARSLGKWLEGRTITAARSQRLKVPADRLVGRTVESVEAQAKHLLIRFSGGDVLHTHMRMTGSWHLYSAGDRWRKPAWQARVVLEAGDRVAVCFNAPVVELLAQGEEERHPSLSGLGPDILDHPFDMEEVLRRVRRQPPQRAVGDVLLDQRILSGIGNIYRCETLFLTRIHPETSAAALDDAALTALIEQAAALMRANLRPAPGYDRRFGPAGGPSGPLVYGRTGRPCFRCRAAIRTAVTGDGPRDVWWCPTCQPPPAVR